MNLPLKEPPVTKTEYRELTKFLTGKFARIDEWFDRLDVISEQTAHQIQRVADGVRLQNELLEQIHVEMNEKLENFRGESRDRFTASDEKLEGLRLDRERRAN
jgi:hypothetical protein